MKGKGKRTWLESITGEDLKSLWSSRYQCDIWIIGESFERGTASHRCLRNKRPARIKIHLGWIASWKWASTAKKIFQTHVKTCSRVLKSLAVEFSPSSHLVFDMGEMMVIYKLQSHIKRAWATTYHTSFRAVARDKDSPEHAFSWQSRTLPLAEDFNFLPVLE